MGCDLSDQTKIKHKDTDMSKFPFTVTLTPSSVKTGTIASGPDAGRKYATLKNADCHFAKNPRKLTVQAFGDARDAIASRLKKGRKITVKAVFKDNVLLVIAPKAAETEAAEAAAA
jgi:hypothetical protein